MTDYAKRTMSDINWLCKSKTVTTPGDDTHDLCRIPANSMVTAIIVEKTTAYTDVGSVVTLGFKGNGETADVDAFMSSTIFAPAEVGTVSTLQGAVKNSGGKYFEKGGMVTVTSDDNAGTAGTFIVYVHYTQLHK